MENTNDGRTWREELTKELKLLNITVFDPYNKPFVHITKEDEESRKQMKQWMINREFEKVADRMKKVRSDDLRLCDLSDFLIAYIDPRVASWGTAEEIVTCNRAKKPIFFIIQGGKSLTPNWLMGMISWRYMFDNINEVIELIKKIDSGEKEIDSNRWRLLREEFR